MSKILEASCVGGVVSVDGLPVDAEILTQGTMASTGFVILDGYSAFYIATNTTDIETLIENLGTIFDKVILILTGLDAASTSPGSQAATIALLTTLKTQFSLQKDLLK